MVSAPVVRALVAAAFALASGAKRAERASHPLHTTLTEVTVDTQRGFMRVMVRVFADDIRLATGVGTDGQAAIYVAASIGFMDAPAHEVPLRSCGTRRRGGLAWFCLEASVPTDRLSHLSMRDALLCERYPDQVNIAQLVAPGGGARRSVLFTRGDGFKPL